MVKRAVFIGRFQPIHNGHVYVIKEISKVVDEVIIVVGSAQYSHSFDNPFTAGERITMIRMALNEAKMNLGKYLIIPLQDVNDNRIWVAHLVSLLPPFDLAYSNNPLVKRLLKEKGIKTAPFEFYHRDKFTGTLIREKMINGEDWTKLVPNTVKEFIIEIDGLERLKDIGNATLKH
ncbi:MAG: nicotinamide-nucleotide adenylyltransferase [Candidatus Lokiarchaeota archaeon]|nr:nicotinamide-nucleotide adenylyltransferase [Candidatus Lokiarchaeota archaeon]